MEKSGADLLREKAKSEGYDKVEDYLVYCEVLGVVKKMNAALDRAFLPDELMKYCDRVDQAVFPKEEDPNL